MQPPRHASHSLAPPGLLLVNEALGTTTAVTLGPEESAVARCVAVGLPAVLRVPPRREGLVALLAAKTTRVPVFAQGRLALSEVHRFAAFRTVRHGGGGGEGVG